MKDTPLSRLKKVCIHGHFYQPPRENPWLEQIERQLSAAPYHDWNERIAHECYAANAAARILDDQDYIVDIVNNFEKISFNIGPTLMEWLKEHRLGVYEAIQRADQRSIDLNRGHGNAIAQAYNHLIMPLANMRDRRTQVAWAIQDFEHHFKRLPEGMWLPETAVDVDTLEALAAHDIAFTILAPSQADRIRPRGSDDPWTQVTESTLDTTIPYLQRLPSGRSIAIFFYDGAISQAVAFERLLERGEFLASRLLHALEDSDRAQLVHIATDGETYGHHHRHGEMALAWALRKIQREPGVSLTNYACFLEDHPPRWEVSVVPYSSWSCAHGVERWRSDCGCQTGGPPEWSQAWRAPLRRGLDALRDELANLFENQGRALFDDIWDVRDAYISTSTLTDPDAIEAQIRQLLDIESPTHEQISRALRLLEMQRQSMLMFTSCGWFFNDVSGIETVQILQYAGRALELADEIAHDPARRTRFLEQLANATSNAKRVSDARQVFEDRIDPLSLRLPEAARHFAVAALFEGSVEVDSDIPFTCNRAQTHSAAVAGGRIEAGLMHVQSIRTLESAPFVYVAAHLGDHNVIGGIYAHDLHVDIRRKHEEARAAFRSAEMVRLIRWFDAEFDQTFDLRALFGEVQSRVIAWLLDSAIREASRVHEELYTEHGPLLRFLAGTSAAPPKVFTYAAESVLNDRLAFAFRASQPSPARLRDLLDEMEESELTVDETRLRRVASERLAHAVSRLRANPNSLPGLRAFSRLCEMVDLAPVEVSLWDARNLCFELLHRLIAEESPEEARFHEVKKAADILRIRATR